MEWRSRLPLVAGQVVAYPKKPCWMMQVGVRVEEEDMRTGRRTHCVSAYLTFVSVAGRNIGSTPFSSVQMAVAVAAAHGARLFP